MDDGECKRPDASVNALMESRRPFVYTALYFEKANTNMNLFHTAPGFCFPVFQLAIRLLHFVLLPRLKFSDILVSTIWTAVLYIPGYI